MPLEFERSYPKLCKLLKRCWAQEPEDRPSFDDIVKTMQGEVAEEVLRKEEPEIMVYSVEDDALYHERIGVDEVFEDEAEDRTAQMASKQQHERVMAELASERDAIKTKYAAMVVELEAFKKAQQKQVEEVKVESAV